MSSRSRLETAGLTLAVLAVLAFVVSAAAGLHLHWPARAATNDDTVAPPPLAAAGALRVDVLNGTTRPGLARQATERLRLAGFDVVYFGNAPEPRGLTLVLDRSGRGDAARRVAAVLGTGEVRVRPDTSLYVDVTVVLGKDWPPPPPPAKRNWPLRAWRALRSAL